MNPPHSTLLALLLFVLPASAEVGFFTDDQDERVVAAVEPIQSLDQSAAAGPKLALRFSARHPNIDAELGWQHPHGMNRNTCFQLNMLSQKEGRLTAATYDSAGKLVTEARRFEILRGPHREHVRLPDGTFRYNQIVEPSVVTGFELHGDVLPPGRYETDIWAYGERRMNLRLVATDTPPQLRILGVKRVAHGDADPERGHFPSDQSFIAADDDEKNAEEEPKPPPRDPVAAEKWKSMTLEQKWAAFDKDYEENRSLVKDWGNYLVRQKDDAFMEQLCLYHGNSFETLGLGWALKSLDSDRWIRNAVWFCNTSGGHGVSIAQIMLDSEDAESEVLAWLERHPEQIDHSMPSNTVKQLREREVKPAKKITALPPHDPKEIYAPWFDKNAKASRGDYDRALQAFAARNRFKQPYFDRFVEIVSTPNEDILRRQSAILTCSKLWHDNLPFDDLLGIVRDAELDPRLREAAVLACNRAKDSQRYMTMHEVVRDPKHPGWIPAVEYMGHYGDAFSLQLIEAIKEVEGLTPLERKVATDKLRERVEKQGETLPTSGFYRLLTAEKHRSPIAAAYREDYIGKIKSHAVEDRTEAQAGRLKKFVNVVSKYTFAEGAEGDAARTLRKELIALAGE